MTREDWLLLVLAAAKDRGLTPVQLQKSLFLLGRGLKGHLGSGFYRFVAHNYGPFDAQIYRDASRLGDEQLLEARNEGRRWPQYYIANKGLQRAKELHREIPREVSEYVTNTVEWTQSLSFRDLVAAIYEKYPAYRVNSIFQQ